MIDYFIFLIVLKRFKNLEEAIIRFQKCDAFKNELIDLRDMPKLKKLKIACNNYPDISQCPGQFRFDISENQKIELSLKMTKATANLQRLLLILGSF